MESLEYILTHEMKEGMTDWMKNHPEQFPYLIDLALSDNEPYSWRASWLLWDIMKPNDERILPYVTDFINGLNNVKPNKIREYLKILFNMDIDEAQEGKLFDLTVKIWSKISHPPAVRINAFKLMIKIAQKYPELKEEMHYLFEDHYLEDLSPGAKHSAQKLIKKFLGNK